MEIVVTCHTSGCENDGHHITLTITDDVSAAMCGPCGTIIEDIKDTNGQAATLPLSTTKEE